MKKFKLYLVVCFLLFIVSSAVSDNFGEMKVGASGSSTQQLTKGTGENSVLVDRNTGDHNGLYWVLFVVLIIWGGISLYLFVIDRKISILEKRLR